MNFLEKNIDKRQKILNFYLVHKSLVFSNSGVSNVVVRQEVIDIVLGYVAIGVISLRSFLGVPKVRITDGVVIEVYK